VESKKNPSSGFWRYADSFSYAPSGAVTSMQFGNGHWESTTYNNRLQPTQIALGTTPAGTDLLKLNYSYNSTSNNGNVLSQTITVPGMTYPLVQTYSYDELNRLSSATETSNGSQTWKQEFSFDRYGNRRFATGTGHTTTIPIGCTDPVCNPTISSNNNRINAVGYTFDNAGNMTVDASGQNYTYDAENKQTQVTNGTGTLGQYWFDGGGKRVKKYVPATGETTVFVYDAAGKPIAEYSTIVAPVSTARVNYLATDYLGSPRINTDQNGALLSRHDYHPFGEEIDGAGGRTIGLNYGNDSLRKQFTGYDSDNESGQQFAVARMYRSASGRFASIDPITAIAPTEPQSLNKYVYAFNSPYKYVDRDGRWPTEIHNLIFQLALPGLSREELTKIQRGSLSVDVPFTVLSSHANEHGMCSPGQGPMSCAMGAISAREENLTIASQRNEGSPENSPSLRSLHYFGRAMHTPQDEASPSHGFETYDDSAFLLCISGHLSACFVYEYQREKHSKEEQFISPEVLDQQIAMTRSYFKRIYPGAYNRAVGAFPVARFMFQGLINGLSGPQGIDLGNLGVVTVHGDGSQDYHGPLTKTE